MKVRSLLLAAGLVLAPLFAATPLAAQKTYTVNLSPAWKAGEKFGLSSAVNQNVLVVITIAPPGQPAQPVQRQAQKVVARLEADAEVLAAFPNGGLQKLALTVKKFTGTDSEAAEKDLLPAGTKIVAERSGGKSVFTVDGKAAPAEIEKFLSPAVELDDAARTDQDVFGPKAPVAVGATWPINGAFFTEEMKESLGESITAKGTMKLDEIKGAGDAQVATISGTMTVENLQAPFPPPFAVKSSGAKIELIGTQPAVHKGVRRQDSKIAMQLVAEGAADGNTLKATMEMSGQNRTEITYR